MNAKPLLTLSREGVAEVVVSGEIVVFDGVRVIFQSSEALSSYPARSLLKPFQFLAIQSNPNSSSLDWRTPALGSVSANQEQVEQIKKWLDQSDRKTLVEKMVLSPTYPWDETHRVLLKQSGSGPSVLYHMCFSKHLNILDACKNHGWDTSHYHKTDHPYHQRLVGVLEEILEEKCNELHWTKDGCKLPTPVLSLKQIAQLFQRLMSAPSANALSFVKKTMESHPEWIGGPERVDSTLMRLNPGSIVAKEGADGLLAIGVAADKKYPRGLGIVLKLASGYQPYLASLALKPIFEFLQIKFEWAQLPDQNLVFHYQPWEVFSPKVFDISPTLHSKIAVWPGDIPFQQKIHLHVENGDHLSLSSIETSVHVGSHTDAPIHFGRSRKSIDDVSLSKYRGLCQVISVQIARGKEIQKRDLDGQSIVAKRVLFKTGSFPNPNQFNQDFNALSAEVIEWLATQGVCLVGIDTPSIDLFESKKLSSHQETLKTEMAILEGIDLSVVPDGVYELSALPLKIQGSDASPVRAVLISTQPPSGS